MRIDEVIESLTAILAQRGNLEVVVMNPYNKDEDNHRIGSVRGWCETGWEIYEQVALITLERDEE